MPQLCLRWLEESILSPGNGIMDNVSFHADAGNHSRVLCKNNECSSLPIRHSKPLPACFLIMTRQLSFHRCLFLADNKTFIMVLESSFY